MEDPRIDTLLRFPKRRSKRERHLSLRGRESTDRARLQRILGGVPRGVPPDADTQAWDELLQEMYEELDWLDAGDLMYLSPAPTPPLPTRAEVEMLEGELMDIADYERIMGE